MKKGILFISTIFVIIFFTINNCFCIHKIYQSRICETPDGDILIANFIIDNDMGDYYELSKLNSDGLLLVSRKYINANLNFQIINSDSILVFYEKINSNYAFAEIINNEFRIIKKDSILIPSRQVSSIVLAHQSGFTYFCFASFSEDPHDVNLIIGKIDKSGNFCDSLRTMPYDDFFPYKLLVSNSKDLYLFFSLAKVIVLDSTFKVKHNYFLFDDVDFTDDYDAFWSSDNTFITGGTSIFGQMMVIQSDLYLNELNKVTFGSTDTIGRAGINSNLAQVIDGFYFAGTSSYSNEYPYASGGSSIFISKINNNFKVEWEKKYGGDASYRVYSVAPSTTGDCWLVASKSENIEASEELVILRIKPDGRIEQFTVGIKENEALVNSIFPNPGQNQINLTLIENSQGLFELYNLEGKLVYQKNYSGKSASFELPDMPTGLYLYELMNAKGKIERGKWVKE